MNDDEKTREQLEQELSELRSQNAALKKSITGNISADLTVEEIRLYAESIAETVREPVLVLDADLKIISANRNFYRTFKVTPNETLGSFIYDLGNKQWDITRLRELLEEILPKKETLDDFEVVHFFRDIGRKIMLLNAHRIYRKDIGAQMILLAIEDITERKQLETEIQDAREYAENIVETVREPLVVLNSDLKILTANHSFYDTFKVTPEETIGNFIYDLGNRQWDIPKLRVLFEEILPHDTVFNGYEVEHDFLDIGRKIILLNARQIFRENIGSHIILLAMEDITERKRAEEANAKLEVQNRQLQKAESLTCMAGAIAHHFNNKLQAVIGTLELALDALPRGDDPVNRLTSAMRAARKAAEMSGLMITYLGHTPGKFEPLDFSEACRRCLPMIQVSIQKDVVLESDLPSPGPTVNANENQIQQVLTNLVTNAEEAFGDGGGSINLRVKTVSPAEIPATHRFPIDWQPQDLAYTCLEVTDTGCGFEEKDIEKIFDPFFSSKFIGRGLGLPVVLGIVRAHYGAVTVESDPGRGSAFRVFLPVSAEEVLLQQDNAAKVPEIEGGGTVLLVEDDELVRNMD
jgi:PAS domain S-box-containing protein